MRRATLGCARAFRSRSFFLGGEVWGDNTTTYWIDSTGEIRQERRKSCSATTKTLFKITRALARTRLSQPRTPQRRLTSHLAQPDKLSRSLASLIMDASTEVRDPQWIGVFGRSNWTRHALPSSSAAPSPTFPGAISAPS
eukprot:scaffold92105_cov72-Phaeocystis_antarctica.AAC.3